MAHAALFSGMALANSGLGLAHGVAAGLGVLAKVPHGLACAVMLPVALRVNRETCESQLAFLARHTLDLDERQDAKAADIFIEHIEGLCAEAENSAAAYGAWPASRAVGRSRAGIAWQQHEWQSSSTQR